MMKSIDLSADVGEGFGPYEIGDDLALLELVSSANIACGFHAGDPVIMDRTVRACLERGVRIGAHPGFNDLQGFGRRIIQRSADEVRVETLFQIGALQAIAQAQGGRVAHITPHGRLGNLCVSEESYARGMIDAVAAFDAAAPVVTQEGHLARLARVCGIPVAITAIADRGYNADGSLVDRRLPGAVIHDETQIIDRVLGMVIDSSVVTADGQRVDIDVHTVLLHGDNPDARLLGGRIRAALEAEGVTIAPLAQVLAERVA